MADLINPKSEMSDAERLEKMEAEMLILKLALILMSNNKRIIIPFNLEKYIRGERLSIVEENILHQAVKAFQYIKSEEHFEIVIP